MSAPTAIGGPIERADGVSAARLQLRSLVGQARADGPQGRRGGVSAAGVIDATSCSRLAIDDGP